MKKILMIAALSIITLSSYAQSQATLRVENKSTCTDINVEVTAWFADNNNNMCVNTGPSIQVIAMNNHYDFPAIHPTPSGYTFIGFTANVLDGTGIFGLGQSVPLYPCASGTSPLSANNVPCGGNPPLFGSLTGTYSAVTALPYDYLLNVQ